VLDHSIFVFQLAGVCLVLVYVMKNLVCPVSLSHAVQYFGCIMC